jgi:NAD(P)-dependent dehydrogenase (short-subunit alcohol dehydrogenase family)
MYGKVALVTGAAQGIGRAVAQRLARDGFNVALNDVYHKRFALSAFRDELMEDFPEGYHTVATADVRKEEEVRGMVSRVVKQLGGLDVLVANAGIATNIRPIVDSDVSQADDIWATNIRGTWLCFHHAARQMIAQGRGGRLIGPSSEMNKSGLAGAAAYSASKSAIRAMTQSAAGELEPFGITVNSYAPGYIMTEIGKGFILGTNGKSDGFYNDYVNTMVTKRNSEPRDVAALVSYLASEQAQDITGQTINVDGGEHFA